MYTIPPIVCRAMTETVTDIGQLSKEQIQTLNSYVKKGYLSRGKGGKYPLPKTVWACPGFDFVASRQMAIDEMFAIAEYEGTLKQSKVLL